MGAIDFYPPFVGPSDVPPLPTLRPHFLGLLPHPGNRAPPQPKRPPLRSLPPGWVRTFHAVPAAYPRQLRESHGTLSRDSHPYGPPPPAQDASKDARNARLHREVASCVRQRYAAHEWSLEEAAAAAPSGLFVGMERWRRAMPSGGKTILCTHANGMHKEHWHPVIRCLLDETAPAAQYGTGAPLGGDALFEIDDVWFMDSSTHNLSMDLNAGLIGPCETWDDTGRDVLNFLLYVLPSVKAGETSGQTTPWQLEWSDKVAPAGKVVAFGASYGGIGHMAAAAVRSDLFEGLFLADPMVRPGYRPIEESITPERYHYGRVRGALKRRDRWVSRDAARESLLALPFYQRWDPEIIDLTVSHGMVDIDGEPGAVELATPGWSEASVFCEPTASDGAWYRLPRIKAPVGFLMAGEPSLDPVITREYVWRPPLSRNERLTGSQHLVVEEAPTAVAAAGRRFLQTLAAGAWGQSPQEIYASYPTPPELVTPPPKPAAGGEDVRAKL